MLGCRGGSSPGIGKLYNKFADRNAETHQMCHKRGPDHLLVLLLERLPVLFRTEESEEEGNMFALGIGRGLSAGGANAVSILRGETLSGRVIVQVSSHLT
ncbi:hypothetical protein QYF36_016633 [Acer negundo]|nr:hypothetical protein QYF36_016633 [Acer negundo]